jgi:predicted ATPase
MKTSIKRSLFFTRIRLRTWRNFESTDVALKSRVFLVGPNASGKSNFLDVFRFLHDIVAVGGGFQEAVQRRRGGVSKIRCLAARRYSDIMVEVQVATSEASGAWEYQIHFSQDNRQRPIIKREGVSHNSNIILDRPNDEDKEDVERLTQTFLEQVNVNRDFRDLADLFGSTRYLHIVPQLIRDPERYIARGRDPFGSDFLEQVAGTQEKTRKARLRRIQEALRIAVPQLQELEFYRDSLKGTPHLRGKYEHWREKGAWQTEEQFSDGTLRLLGLLWASMDGTGPLLLEEPELSLHPDIVRFLPQLFARVQSRSGRQVLISTHSPDLLRDEGIGLDEVLLLIPSGEGTKIDTAGSLQDVRHLLDGGVPLAEAILPHTRPAKPEQLALFDV